MAEAAHDLAPPAYLPRARLPAPDRPDRPGQSERLGYFQSRLERDIIRRSTYQNKVARLAKSAREAATYWLGWK